jgi:hypothetical protein
VGPPTSELRRIHGALTQRGIRYQNIGCESFVMVMVGCQTWIGTNAQREIREILHWWERSLTFRDAHIDRRIPFHGNHAAPRFVVDRNMTAGSYTRVRDRCTTGSCDWLRPGSHRLLSSTRTLELSVWRVSRSFIARRISLPSGQ